MQHTYEFIANLKDGGHVRMIYKGKSSRHRKVADKITKDLKSMYNIEPDQVFEILLSPVKTKTK